MVAACIWLAPAPGHTQSSGAAASDAAGLPPASAQRPPSPEQPPGGRPLATAVRVAVPPNIDGRLNDEIWRTAAQLDQFVQQRPLEGVPATERTEIFIAYDSEKMYFGIYAHYSNPDLIRANRVDRDKTENDDTVTVSFDPFLDEQQGYSFSVNGYGVQGDSVLRGGSTGTGGIGAPASGTTPSPSSTGSGGSSSLTGASGAANSGATGDISWNALFASAGQLVEDGWTAEMAIPFKSLRYPGRGTDQPHRWGFQIQREIQTKFETAVWAPVSRDVTGFLRQMGVLTGFTNLSTSRNFEILPSFTAVQTSSLSTTTGRFTSTDVEEGGVNVKYGLSSTLTFDFTFNPDFSQIESDRQQIEVNLRFPVSYPEQRPFFIEGQDIFRVGGPFTMIHTRTIVDPRYGAKLSGKVGKTSLGFLVANDQAPGRIEDSQDPAYRKSAQIVIGRGRYDLYTGSFVGTFVTNRQFLGGYSRLVGVDTQLQLGRNHRLSGATVRSDNRASDGVQSAGQYYEANLRREGRNLGYFFGTYHLPPQFRTDLGFIRRVDQKQMSARMSYKWWPEGWIVNWGPEFNYDRNYSWAGTLQNTGPGAILNVQFAKNINVTATVDRDMERYREIDFQKFRYSITGRVNTSRRISFSATVNRGDEVRFIANPYLGQTTVYNLSTTFRPVSRLQSIVNLDTSRFMDVRTNTEVFDIKLLRAQTTYQFTPRLLVRNIMELNTFSKTLFANLLVTYRVNSGTAFYLGYDDRYSHGDMINPLLFPEARYQRTNRSIFTKLQYLFRNNSD
jgi:hypothetical protein